MHKKKNSRDDNLWGENNKKLFLIVIYFLWLKKTQILIKPKHILTSTKSLYMR